MARVITIVLLALAGYGLFLTVRALLQLYRAGEHKLVWYAVAFVLGTPLLLWLSALIPEERISIWTALPTILLFFVWICFGYFLESFRKNRAKEIEMGIYKQKKPGNQRRNLLVCLAGLVIWFVGAFVQIPNRTLEICLLCVSVFLLASGIGSLWRNRSF